MATLVQSVPRSQPPLHWFWEFLKHELAPYPRRAGTVARMVLAATVIMIIPLTFRIPYGFQGALYALLISRENLRATLQSAAIMFLVTVAGATYLLVSAWFVISNPPLHFLWVIGSFFLAFYALSTLTIYLTAVFFAIIIAVGVPLWDRHLPAENSVEDTLWLCWITLIALVITVGIELAFARRQPGEEVILRLTEHLSATENLFRCYAEGRVVDPDTEQKVIRLGMLGTSMLRKILRRSTHSPPYRATMGTVAVLVGSLTDLSAALTQLSFQPSASDQRRFRNLASTIATIRNGLINHRIPDPVQFNRNDQSATAVPLLGQLEDIVKLIPEAFADSRSTDQHLPSPEDTPRPALFASDALVNSEHFQFALKGCLAASACYMFYNAAAWPGISTAVTTCLLTALSTIGASRQKQILRITGAITGGLLIGMGSQVFILPHVDSITGFTVLFVIVTALSSWVMTSSPRLSYFGLQMALAFYLINLQEFKMQTSLEVARDRVLGILLGLFMMWLVFDQLWGASAAVEMKRRFVSNIRLLAQFAREPSSEDRTTAVKQSISLRETIHTNLDSVRAIADGVLLEFGPSRKQNLALRDRIRQWQTQLRVLFITRIALWKYRMRLPGFQLPEPIWLAQREFDAEVAKTLETVADRLEGRPAGQRGPELHACFEHLEQAVQTFGLKDLHKVLPEQLATFLTLSRRLGELAISLDQDSLPLA
jgi:multidrug resistance protein MdtO